MSDSKNILIVGNGFDLSHYLPTKYDHFMDVMKNIEEFTGDEMSFDDLYKDCREAWFIDKTKQYYLTDEIKLDIDKIQEVKNLLTDNGWYKYFKTHVKDIDTWIDFEQKIEELLKYFGSISIELKECKSESEINRYIKSSNGTYSINKLNDFKISIPVTTDDENLNDNQNSDPLSFEALLIKTPPIICLNPIFCYGEKIENGFNSSSFSKHLYQQLENFIEIFNLYLEVIIKKLQPKFPFRIKDRDWKQPHKIYSFN